MEVFAQSFHYESDCQGYIIRIGCEREYTEKLKPLYTYRCIKHKLISNDTLESLSFECDRELNIEETIRTFVQLQKLAKL